MILFQIVFTLLFFSIHVNYIISEMYLIYIDIESPQKIVDVT